MRVLYPTLLCSSICCLLCATALADPRPPVADEDLPPGMKPVHQSASGAIDKGQKPQATPEPEAEKNTEKKNSEKKQAKASKKAKKTAKRKVARKRRQSKKPKGHKSCDYLTPLHTHEVFKGEILGEIAGRYGVTITDLKTLNPRDLRNPDRIFPGMKLAVCPSIPPRERLREDYLVRRRDTLSKIAKRFDLTVDELVSFQGRKFNRKKGLKVGQKLVIWRDGDVLAAFAPPDQDKGKLKMSYRLRKSGHYHIKRPHRSFGTRSTVQLIYKVMNTYRRKYKGPVVVMGDLSKKGGGQISGHVSHQTGMDVDIGFVHTRKAGKLKDFIKATKSNLDVKRTWGLVHAFLKTNQIRYMFIDYDVQARLYKYARKRGVSKNKLSQWFQYPRSKKRAYGIVRHWKNHDDHIHVRFRK
ncbi:MAG: penicillin-insensitive murein endopeptidase [Bradymonadia bacterium]